MFCAGMEAHVVNDPVSNRYRSSSEVVASFVPERPPSDFWVEFSYIPGGSTIGRFDLWTAIVITMARLALYEWDAEVRNRLVFRRPSNVETVIISSIDPPRYRVKSILWTLHRAFTAYNDQGLYTTASIKTRVGEGADEHYLGLARIKGIEASVTTDSQTNSLTSPLGNDTSSIMTPSSDESLDPGPPFSPGAVAASDGQNDTSPQAKGFEIGLLYTPGGASFLPQGFYGLVVNALVWVAQHDPKTGPSGLVSVYNTVDNYTLAISPTSTAARDKMPWDIVIQVMAVLPVEMLASGRGGRWAELQGRVKYDGEYIGRLKIAKGDFQRELRGPYEDHRAAAGDRGVDPCDLLSG